MPPGQNAERRDGARAVDFLKGKGYKKIAIVSHSLGATMANQYLIRTEDTSVGAWVSISILQGLQEMFRIKIPVLDVFASNDWSTNVYGAPIAERVETNTGVPLLDSVAVTLWKCLDLAGVRGLDQRWGKLLS